MDNYSTTMDKIQEYFGPEILDPENITVKFPAYSPLSKAWKPATWSLDAVLENQHLKSHLKNVKIVISAEENSAPRYITKPTVEWPKYGDRDDIITESTECFNQDTSSAPAERNGIFATLTEYPSEKQIKVYFSDQLKYPVSSTGEPQNPFYDYCSPQLAHLLGVKNSEICASVMIGHYYDISEKLAYFVFDPSEDASSVLICTSGRYCEPYKFPYQPIQRYFYQPSYCEALTMQGNCLSSCDLTIAPLHSHRCNDSDIQMSSHELKDTLFQAFADFWVSFGLWPIHLNPDNFPDELRQIQSKLKDVQNYLDDSKLKETANPYINPDRLTNYLLDWVERSSLYEITWRNGFYRQVISLEPDPEAQPQTLTMLFPDNYHILQHQDPRKADLNWKDEYLVPEVINIIGSGKYTSKLSILMGYWIKDLNWFIIDESSQANSLLVVDYFYGDIPCSPIDTDQNHIDFCGLQSPAYTKDKSFYRFTVVSLDSSKPKERIRQLYYEFLLKYEAEPVAKDLSAVIDEANALIQSPS